MIHYQRRCQRFCVAMFVTLILTATTLSQTKNEQSQNKPLPSIVPLAHPAAPLVKLNLIVTDRSNHSVDGVRQDELRITEDGKPRTISFFSQEELPVSYGFVIDTSGSFRKSLPAVVEAAKSVINSNKSDDETFIVRFVSNDSIDVVTDFTSDKSLLLAGLEDLYVAKGQTAVIDAVYLSAKHLTERKANDRRRHALVLITDGEERASFYRKDKLLKLLGASDVQIFIIGIVRDLKTFGGFFRRSPREQASSLLNTLAKETGGRVFYPDSVVELESAIKEISHDLHTQYVIGYDSIVDVRTISKRKVQVIVTNAPDGGKRLAFTRAAP